MSIRSWLIFCVFVLIMGVVDLTLCIIDREERRLVNLFMIKVHFKSPSANVRYALDVEKSWEKIWYSITALWLVLNILCVAVTAIKLIFMYL